MDPRGRGKQAETVIPGFCKNCGKPEVHDINLCAECYQDSILIRRDDGTIYSWYTPQPHQRPYHQCLTPNLLALGTRGTGKSTMMRKDAIIRCMTWPGFRVLILRRKITDLRKSHLRFINPEMKALGDDVGYYRETTLDVIFKNGSFIQFSHCETMADVENYLSSEWDLIVFDELSTFTLDMFLRICAAARSSEEAPFISLVRAGSNPLGAGAGWMKEWFVDKTVDLAEYPDYLPDDFEMHFSTLDQNKYVNRKEYEKRLRNLPDHIRRAWLLGEFVIEGAYFGEFKQRREVDVDGRKEIIDWHVIQEMPKWFDNSTKQYRDVRDLGWVSIYRAIDWGYNPDPAVCLWIALLPNKWSIVFKEKTWRQTVAKVVAEDIKEISKDMNVVETFCDPTMFVKTGTVEYSIGEIFENYGVPLTQGQNNRELYGYSVQDQLKTEIDGRPQLQIYKHCKVWGPGDEKKDSNLIRTFPLLQMDEKDPRKIANGPDHWVVALAQYSMGHAMPARDPIAQVTKRWLQPKVPKPIDADAYC